MSRQPDTLSLVPPPLRPLSTAPRPCDPRTRRRARDLRQGLAALVITGGATAGLTALGAAVLAILAGLAAFIIALAVLELLVREPKPG